MANKIPLRLWTDSALTKMVSWGGAHLLSDADTGTGAYPEELECALWVAMEQAVIDGDVDDSQELIKITAPHFALSDYPVIRSAGGEEMLITGGPGTKVLTVTRGYNSTSPAALSDGDRLYSAYWAHSGKIYPADVEGTDESSWLKFSQDVDPKVYGSSVMLTSPLGPTSSQKIWRRVTVPDGTEAEYKTDLRHRFRGTIKRTA